MGRRRIGVLDSGARGGHRQRCFRPRSEARPPFFLLPPLLQLDLITLSFLLHTQVVMPGNLPMGSSKHFFMSWSADELRPACIFLIRRLTWHLWGGDPAAHCCGIANPLLFRLVKPWEPPRTDHPFVLTCTLMGVACRARRLIRLCIVGHRPSEAASSIFRQAYLIGVCKVP